MPSMPWTALVLSLLALGPLAACDTKPPPARCSDTLGCVILGPDEPIKIGVLQALSGKVAPLGIEQLRGLELALNQRQGKVAGHAVALQTEDCRCTSEGGANAALKIVADPQIVAIYGTTCSGAAATAAKVMTDAGLTMISGNNSAPFLTSIGGKQAPNWQPGYFRTAPNEENSGKAAATFAHTVLGVRRAAVINDGDIYTRGLTDGFAQTFTQLGGTIALNASVEKGDRETGPILQAVADANAELLFFPLFQPEGNYLLSRARSHQQLAQVILMSDGALIEQSFLDAVGDLARGMYFVGPRPADTPRGRDLAATYRATFSTAPATSYYQSGFDAADLLFRAIEQTAQRLDNGGLSIGRQALRQQMYATRNFAGVTGILSCDQFGDCASPAFNVLRLDDPQGGVAGLQQNVQFTFAPTSQETNSGGRAK